ncbi:phage tail terminator family protein [Paenibacillus elgii]|uniref:phage tail terminator family protein n=1 Tax=Paenibacillus elgii TaxID=189691 RepID=UPI00203F2E0D|nr:hypothetical protein [Paenibacillus elgii]MCM3273662.1 hypothetical protein [Paenibacillus elgii]
MEQIVNGITKRLADLFPAMNIYTERIEQGFVEPAFFVLQVDSSQQRGVNRRYIRSAMYDIHFFPDRQGTELKRECERVRDDLYEKMEYIKWDGTTYRGTGMRAEIVDDVLHFFLSFEVHLMRPKVAGPTMQHLEQEEYVRD